MLYIFVVTLLLPSALTYTIKVKGTVELGDEIGAIFNALRERFLTQYNDMSPPYAEQNIPPSYSVPVAQNSDGMPHPQDYPNFINPVPYMEKNPNDVRISESVDVPLLDEIVAKREGQVHLYGAHEGVKGKGPLNKVVV
ncbi:hypothetical protein ABMA28_008464 [Loxostege sticticalis]|uniref:Uncharacterized protein n=1 Tax=Loxostege sticticalis TaxID=481309 RepID=A0ABD0SH98_LOXSC